MVLRFGFSTVEVEDNFDVIRSNFRRICYVEYRGFLARYSEYFRGADIEVSSGDSGVLRDILGVVQERGLPPVHIIIDEYDNFTNQLIVSQRENLYREVTTGDSFLRTFFELCTRYLSFDFVFTIEVNHPSGRSDWEMLGKHHTEYRNIKVVIEFKHFTNTEGQKRKVLELDAPYRDDAAQVARYADDIYARFPDYKIRTFVLYTVGNTGFRCFETTPDDGV